MGRARLVRVAIATTAIAACVTYVHYSSTEQHQTVHPASVNHGSVEIGANSLRSITVSPAATGSNQFDTVQSVVEQSGGCANFDIIFMPDGPPPHEVSATCTDLGSGTGGSAMICSMFDIVNYTFQTKFTPSFEGTDTCNIILMISGAVSSIVLTGTGVRPPIDVQVEVANVGCKGCTVDLGPANVNRTTSPSTIEVVNRGSSNATLTSVSVGDTQHFAVTGTVGTLASDQSRFFDVTCTPNAEAGFTDVLTIVSDDPDSPSQTVNLKCQGVVSDLSTKPTTLTMKTRLHEPTAPFDLEIENTSASTVNITDITVDQPGFTISQFTPGGLLTLQKTTVKVTYDGSVANNNATDPLATLTIHFEGTKVRDVPIKGPWLETSYSLNGSGDFGPVCLGKTRTQTFNLFASGDAAFSLDNVEVLIGDEIFAVTRRPPMLPLTLMEQRGNEAEFDVTVTPAVLGDAPRGTLAVTTDIPDENTIGLELNVFGAGVGASVTPTKAIDFGSVMIDANTEVTNRSEPQKVTFIHCGSPTTILGTRIVGDQDFEVTVSPAPKVEADVPVVFEVVFAPRFGGRKTATLEIEHESGVSGAGLVGVGIGPEEPGNPRDTYYRCSAGNASGASPLLLVLLAVLRRRRRR
jgi:uncharacterized protein (TIGR03382 family)